jgi:hypothetical protein
MPQKNDWTVISIYDVDTLPPPFERLEIECKPRVLYPKCPAYTHCFGMRNGIHSVQLFYADGTTKDVGFQAILKWRKHSVEVL